MYDIPYFGEEGQESLRRDDDANRSGVDRGECPCGLKPGLQATGTFAPYRTCVKEEVYSCFLLPSLIAGSLRAYPFGVVLTRFGSSR